MDGGRPGSQVKETCGLLILSVKILLLQIGELLYPTREFTGDLGFAYCSRDWIWQVSSYLEQIQPWHIQQMSNHWGSAALSYVLSSVPEWALHFKEK